MTPKPLMHLKPWSKVYSTQCGCALDRRVDGGVAYVACDAHERAFRAVCGILAAGRHPTQTEIARAARGNAQAGG